METANIRDGDILIVDCAKPATTSRIVVAMLDREFNVKRLLWTEKGTCLITSATGLFPYPRIQTFRIGRGDVYDSLAVRGGG